VLLADSAPKGLKLLDENPVSLVISDARMPEMDGFTLLDAVKKKFPALPFIMITAYATPQLAVKAIKAGPRAITSPKPFDPEELIHVVENTFNASACSRKTASSRGRGHSQCRRHHRQQRADRADQGTRSHRRAHTIHRAHRRRKRHRQGTRGRGVAQAQQPQRQTFIRVNCAAIPENLLESEFFGHEKGAFTGADRQRHGKFEDANGGTILLDEIGDMSRQLQSKMLRVLEDGTFTRVGGNDVIKVNVRILAATTATGTLPKTTGVHPRHHQKFPRESPRLSDARAVNSLSFTPAPMSTPSPPRAARS